MSASTDTTDEAPTTDDELSVQRFRASKKDTQDGQRRNRLYEFTDDILVSFVFASVFAVWAASKIDPGISLPPSFDNAVYYAFLLALTYAFGKHVNPPSMIDRLR